ncbi:acyltransferase family protein [Escherichia coli]|uniref:acyltransferase family protein n=1 Tax=Escherichia coli TaxID=562 RepID=UPI002FBEBC27
MLNCNLFSFLDRREAIANNSHTRENNIDGLRYFLAAFVAMHHFPLAINFVHTGEWVAVDGHAFDDFLGTFAVSIFFMISAYLFWGRCYSSEFNWIKLFIGRLFRIGPMFIVSSLCCWAVAYKFGSNRNIDILSIQDVFHWFDMGFTNIRPDMFGFKNSYLINAGVMWTLPLEWMFYLSLPLFSLITNNKTSLAVVLAAFFIDFYFYKDSNSLLSCLYAMFIMGALSFEIKK